MAQKTPVLKVTNLKKAFGPVVIVDGFSLEVDVVEELGADGYVYGTVAGLSTEEKLTATQIVARVSARTPPQRGSVVKLSPRDASSLHIFSPKTEARLN